MADQTIGGARKVFAAFYRIGLGEIGRGAGWIGTLVVRKRNCRTSGEGHRCGNKGPPRKHAENPNHDDGNNTRNDTHDRQAFFGNAIAARSIGNRRKAMPVAA